MFQGHQFFWGFSSFLGARKDFTGQRINTNVQLGNLMTDDDRTTPKNDNLESLLEATQRFDQVTARCSDVEDPSVHTYAVFPSCSGFITVESEYQQLKKKGAEVLGNYNLKSFLMWRNSRNLLKSKF